MSVFWAMPEIHAVVTRKPSAKRGTHRKYDHFQMLRDRMDGMTWGEIAKKHGVITSSRDAGLVAHDLVFCSKAMRALKPCEVAALRIKKSGL